MSSYGDRIRTARAWAGMSQQVLADALGVEIQTVKRREADKQAPKPGERLAIAQLTGVPVAFMENGFDGLQPIGGGGGLDPAVGDQLGKILAAEVENGRLLRELAERTESPGTDAEHLARLEDLLLQVRAQLSVLDAAGLRSSTEGSETTPGLPDAQQQ